MVTQGSILPFQLSFLYPPSCKASLDSGFSSPLSTHLFHSSLVSLEVPVGLCVSLSLYLSLSSLSSLSPPPSPSLRFTDFLPCLSELCPTHLEVWVHFIRFRLPQGSPVQRDLEVVTWWELACFEVARPPSVAHVGLLAHTPLSSNPSSIKGARGQRGMAGTLENVLDP